MTSTRAPHTPNPSASSEYSLSRAAIKLDPMERLPHLLQTALTQPSFKLAQCLSDAQLHFLKTFYLPSVPDTSDTRRTQFQHRANGCSRLSEELADMGYSRENVKRGLEQIRYLSFLDGVDQWIQRGSSSQITAGPNPITFDIRSRAHAKDAFKDVAQHLRIPPHLFEYGTITPVFRPRLGFAFQVSCDGKTSTFLCALPNGERLKPAPDDAQANARGLSSPNRQLLNILGVQAPVNLELALAPRPVKYVGSLRVKLFLGYDRSSPATLIYLPPSVKDSALLPRVDMSALIDGEKKVHLIGASSKQIVATVTILGAEEVITKVELGTTVTPSPFKRFTSLAAFLNGASKDRPTPLIIDVNRSERTARHSHQRLLLGPQITVPAWYPLRTIVVHPLTTPGGSHYIGLYPPGASPLTTPPLRTYTLEEAGTLWKPVIIGEVWKGPMDQSKQLLSLLRQVMHPSTGTSRDAWLSVHQMSREGPAVVYSLLCAKQSPLSLHDQDALKKVRELAGWEGFKSGLESSLFKLQAQSVPFVAGLLAAAQNIRHDEVAVTLRRLMDLAWETPEDPALRLTRLAVVAQPHLETTLTHIRESPVPAFAALAGTSPLHQLLNALGSKRGY